MIQVLGFVFAWALVATVLCLFIGSSTLDRQAELKAKLFREKAVNEEISRQLGDANRQIDSLKKQVAHAAKVTGEWGEKHHHDEVSITLERLRTSRMIGKFVAHLKERGDTVSLAALKEIDTDARTYNPIFKPIHPQAEAQPSLLQP